MKKNLKLIIGVVVSAGLLVFLFSRIDFARLVDSLRRTSPYMVSVVVCVHLTSFYVRAYRWKFLMDPVKRGIPTSHLFSATMIGFMANNVLPARLGEFVRAYAIARKESVQSSSAFATIVVERLFDVMSVLLLLIATLVFMPEAVAGGEAAKALHGAGMFSIAVFAGLVVALGLSARYPSLPGRVAGAVIAPVSDRLAGRVVALADGFVAGVEAVKSPGLVSRITLLSGVHWALATSTVYLLFAAMGIDLGVYAAVLVFTMFCLGVALPSTPGAVGTFHAAGMLGLVLMGLDRETALSFAIVAHAANYLPVTLLGFYYLWKENMSLSGLRKIEAVEGT